MDIGQGNNRLEQVEFKLEKNIGIQKLAGKVRKGSCFFSQKLQNSPWWKTKMMYCKKEAFSGSWITTVSFLKCHDH